MPRARSSKSADVTIKVDFSGPEIKIRHGALVATYPVVDHMVTVGADDPNLGRLRTLGNEVGAKPGSNPTPETPADPQE